MVKEINAKFFTKDLFCKRGPGHKLTPKLLFEGNLSMHSIKDFMSFVSNRTLPT